MNFVLILDPLETLKPVKDSSIAIMREANRRGHGVYTMQQTDMCWRDGQVSAHATCITPTDDDAGWYLAHESAWQALTAFDAVLMRKDPPFDSEYLYATQLLDMAQQAGARVFNAPAALRDFNEKLAILRFPELISPTLVSRDSEALRAFAREQADVILKPLDGMGGMEVFRVREDALNLNVIIETLTRNESRTIMAQRYIPAVSAGDKRVFMIDGQVAPYVLARIPLEGETRANLAAGGRGVAQLLSERDRAIAAMVGSVLKDAGLLLVGLDIIGDYLTEINVTSPTGMVEISAQTDCNVAGLFVDALERRCC